MYNKNANTKACVTIIFAYSVTNSTFTKHNSKSAKLLYISADLMLVFVTS